MCTAARPWPTLTKTNAAPRGGEVRAIRRGIEGCSWLSLFSEHVGLRKKQPWKTPSPPSARRHGLGLDKALVCEQAHGQGDILVDRHDLIRTAIEPSPASGSWSHAPTAPPISLSFPCSCCKREREEGVESTNAARPAAKVQGLLPLAPVPCAPSPAPTT